MLLYSTLTERQQPLCWRAVIAAKCVFFNMEANDAYSLLNDQLETIKYQYHRNRRHNIINSSYFS